MNLSLTEAIPDGLGEVTSSPPSASRAPSIEDVLVANEIRESLRFDALHGGSMIRRQGQDVSLQ